MTEEHKVANLMNNVEGVDIPAFTPEDVQAIASIPLSLVKPILTEAQFGALTKFVNINQIVTGLGADVKHDA